MELKKDYITFIGGGNMAQALIEGLLTCEIPSEHIRVSDPVKKVRELLKNKGLQVFESNHEAIQKADIVVLAVKPQILEAVLIPIKNELSEKLIISVVAGVTIETLQNLSGSQRVIRVMPNTPALVQKGTFGLLSSQTVTIPERETITRLFSATGLVIWMREEAEIDVVTAISGSGPAYFFYLMDHMIRAGVDLGLDEDTAVALTLQTALGAAEMALQSDVHVSELCKRVTSPNGTTQAALTVLNNQHVDLHIQQAIHAACQRSRELAVEFAGTTY